MATQPKQQDNTAQIETTDHLKCMTVALIAARNSPPKPTNFCVGACLTSHNPSTRQNEILTTGYTLECAGNTHAEQSCFIKLAAHYNCPERDLGLHLPEQTWLYTTMEPCNKRSVGNTPCVDRILALRRADGTPAIEKVLVGVLEPETFVGVNEGRRRLEDAGVDVVKVDGLEEEILGVAKAGHDNGGIL